jgi:hypothetical protein
MKDRCEFDLTSDLIERQMLGLSCSLHSALTKLGWPAVLLHDTSFLAICFVVNNMANCLLFAKTCHRCAKCI